MIWFWIAFFIVSCIGAKVSLISNDNGGGKWFWIACCISAIPWFPLMTVWTKSILIDSVVYDAIILFAYLGVYFYSGAGKLITLTQYIGLGFTIIGLILMKAKA